MNLFLVCKFYLPLIPVGNVIEYGSYRGGTAMFMAALFRRLGRATHVWALDTFCGMPPTRDDLDAHSSGDFSETDLAEIEAASARAGLSNVTFVKGLFEDTAADVLSRSGPVALAHIDCDIYDAVKFAYEASTSHMVPGGYYIFDDATAASCIGATEVVEDVVVRRDGRLSEQIFPHFVFRHDT